MSVNQPVVSALLNEIASNGKTFNDSSDEQARLNLVEAASKLIATLENPMEQLARICWGEPSRHAALQTLFEMGVLKKLNMETPLSSAQLAEGTTADPALIARLIKHVKAYNLVDEADTDQYKATPFTLASTDPALESGMIYCFDTLPSIYAKMPEFLAKTQYQDPVDPNHSPLNYGLNTDLNFFGYLKHHTAIGGAFNRFMGEHARTKPGWTECYPCAERLSPSSTSTTTTATTTQDPQDSVLLVDVGGGLGHCLANFHLKHPNIPGKLVLQDQPQVIEQAAQQIASQSLPIDPIPHNFTQPQPQAYHGAKAYFMRRILHDWSDDTCVTILSHLRDAMQPNHSVILINELVISDRGAVWQQTSLDMTMMALLSSRERTESQWRALLARAGLKINAIYQKGIDSEAVIEAVRADDQTI